MLNYLIKLVFALSLAVLVGCSSSDSNNQDLDITEIQEIEATGEFSEDEFFTDEGAEVAKEEKLVDEVAGLESELDISEEETDVLGEGLQISAEEGEDLFADVQIEEGVQEEAGKQSVNINDDSLNDVLAEDLGSTEESIVSDMEDVSVATAEETVLNLDSEDDLFREDSGSVQPQTTSEPTAQAIVQEDVSIDVDYSDVTAPSSSEQSAASKLSAENVSIDVDYGSVGSEPKSFAATNKSFIPVKKMKTVPYTKNGVLVNAIYFVRQGDNLQDVANKIYGNGSGVDFTVVNPHLKRGSLRVGQKIYYNSPQRPQDRSRLLTYYEDARVPAMNYSAQAGENIRSISKNLLGHDRSWMEVWATNMGVESKGELEGPYQLRYWKGSAPAPAAPVLAKVEPPKEQPVEPAPAPAEEPTNIAQADLNLDQVTEEQASLDEPVLDEPVIEEPVAASATPSQPEVAEVDDTVMDDGDLNFEDSVEPEAEVAAAGDPVVEEEFQDPAAVTAVANPRDLARNQGAFPAKSSGGLFGDTTRMAILGLALLILLAVGFLIVKRRRASQENIEMESFDFGGDTVIENEQEKTQIDL